MHGLSNIDDAGFFFFSKLAVAKEPVTGTQPSSPPLKYVCMGTAHQWHKLVQWPRSRERD